MRFLCLINHVLPEQLNLKDIMLSRKLTLEHITKQIKDKRILMRVDFNVPLKDGVVSDATRINSTLKSINHCLEHGAKSVVLMSHLGRPKGSRSDKFSMKPVIPVLEDLLQKKVEFLNDCVGSEVEQACGSASNGKILMLENLRFHLAEEGKGEKDG
jgi:phosphoglycerate kinase